MAAEVAGRRRHRAVEAVALEEDQAGCHGAWEECHGELPGLPEEVPEGEVNHEPWARGRWAAIMGRE